MDASMIFFYRRHQMEWKIAYFLHFFLCVRVCVASRTLKEGGGQPESLRSRFRQFCDLFFLREHLARMSEVIVLSLRRRVRRLRLRRA